MTLPSPAAESSSLLSGPKFFKWVEQSESSSLNASDPSHRRRRRHLCCVFFIMLIASFVFFAGLVLSLAVPQHKRQAGGPVIGSNFQDPSVVQLNDGSWMAYAGVNGNPPGINVLIATSSDFASWTVRNGYDALPNLPSWAASPPHVWAPDVTQLVSFFWLRPGLPSFNASLNRTMGFMCYTTLSPWHRVRANIVWLLQRLPTRQDRSRQFRRHYSVI